MTLVRIIKNWQEPNLLQQTPNHLGVWDGIRFTLEPVQQCDYVVILNRFLEGSAVTAFRKIWAIIQEPPRQEYKWWYKGLSRAELIFTPETELQNPRFVHSHGALPWHVRRSYDELIKAPVPEKTRDLSWITSNLTTLKGHRERMDFLNRIRNDVEFDLWGRGFSAIEDKWDGLSAYRYAFAIENYSGRDYWTEKLADCFLSWTMPIYYGCINLKDYFPEESYIWIDIHDPDAAKQINSIVKSRRWQENQDAIAYARELVLNRYQLFPFVTELVRQDQAKSAVEPFAESRMLTLRPFSYYDSLSPLHKLGYCLKRVLSSYVPFGNTTSSAGRRPRTPLLRQ